MMFKTDLQKQLIKAGLVTEEKVDKYNKRKSKKEWEQRQKQKQDKIANDIYKGIKRI